MGFLDGMGMGLLVVGIGKEGQGRGGLLEYGQ
jgi:hypothetical protein